jgi:hypothetical protein
VGHSKTLQIRNDKKKNSTEAILQDYVSYINFVENLGFLKWEITVTKCD